MPEIKHFKASHRFLIPNHSGTRQHSAMISLSITGTATVRRINSATQTEPCPEYRVFSGQSSEQVAVQTYTGYIQCRLKEFATFIYESETITSDKIYIGGIPWMIKICSKRVNNASNVIGFYTKCGYDFGKDDEGLNNITANIEMIMKSSNDSSKSHFSRKFSETFTKSHSEWGYSEFRTIEDGFVQSNKTSIFESRITVVRPKQKLSPEKCRRKVQELMSVARMQAERGILDKAIEANEIAFTLCFEEKDGDIMKDLEKQRDELIEKKLKQSIERLQKDEDASKCAAVPLKSACKHIGVLKKPPKKKNNNQRPKIKLAAPSKPKETRSIGTNTDDTYDPQKPSPELDTNENLRYQTLCVLPPEEAEKVHLMIGLILPFIKDTIPERLFIARLQSAEHVFYELMKMSGCKPEYKNTEFDNIIHYDSFRESLVEMNICNEQSPPNDILRVLFSAVFPDYSKFMKEINGYIINMAIDNRKMLEQVLMIGDSVINVYQNIKEKSKKSLESKVNADLDKHDLRALRMYYEKMNPSALQPGPKKMITLFSAHALKLKIYFRKLGTAKRDFLNSYIQRRKATIEKNKNIIKSFEDRYERLSVRHAFLAAQYNTQHSILKNRKEKFAALLSLQKSIQEIQKHYGEKMGILNKMAKDLENSQMQVKKCEELLFRLKKDREDVAKNGKQKLKEENAERQQMKEKVESLKLELYKYDVELKKALAVESPTPSLSFEKAKAQSINLQLLETKRSVAIEKLDHIDLLLQKDERYLKAELPQKIYECIVQRFKKNLLMKRAIENILKCIDDEMDSVQHGYPMDFSRINIPTIFVDEFGEI